MKRLVSILLAYCILIIQIGCTTTKYLSFQQVKETKSSKNYLTLHTPQNIFIVENYMFTNESLEGNLMSLSDEKKDGIHVYTEQYIDSDSIPNKSSYIIIPKSNINIITKPYYNKKNTKYLVASVGILIFLISNAGPQQTRHPFF